MKDKDTFIKFEAKGIRIGYQVYRTQRAGFVTSYIPGFDIAFSAPSREIAKERAPKMIMHFFDYYIQQQTWREFMLKIHKLGFRTELHNHQMKKMLNKRPINAQFSADKSVTQISAMFSNPDDVISEMNHIELAY